MSEKKKHISNKDFQRYLKNQMTEAERNVFEREMQKHPFEEEALEGMQQFDADEIQNDWHHLSNRISQKNKKRNARFRAAAATFLLLISAGIIWFQLREPSPVPEMAETEDVLTQPEKTVSKDQPAEKNLTESTSEIEKALDEEIESDTEVEKSIETKDLKQQPQQKKVPDETIDDQLEIAASEIKAPKAQNIAPIKNIQTKESEMLADTELKKDKQQIRVRGVSSLAASSSRKEDSAPLTKADTEFSSQKIVQGKVISLGDSLPLPDVSIVEKGTSNGTVSDVNGNFTLLLTDNNDSTLVASFIGMENREFYPTGDSLITVGLEPSQVALEEVVAVGYGLQEKDAFTGSVSKIEDVPSSAGAEPKNGLPDFKAYIKENAILPENYAEKRVMVRARIKIDVQGKIISVENKNDADNLWFEKAKELILKGPEWKPKTINDTPVETEVTLRIVFKKTDDNE